LTQFELNKKTTQTYPNQFSTPPKKAGNSPSYSTEGDGI